MPHNSQQTNSTTTNANTKDSILRNRIDSRKDIYADDVSHFAVTIGKPPEEVYRFFRDFQNLPLFMKDLKEIQTLSPKRTKWVVQLDEGPQVEWEAEITTERPNEMISWKSVEGSQVSTEGSVWFRPAPEGFGTIVSLAMDYSVPGGKLTEWLTMLKGEDPDSLTFTNLRRLKCFLETGEIATTKGQTSGREEDLESTTKH